MCEQEITIIVPLVLDLLKKRGHTVEALKTDFNLWEELKKRKGDFDIVFNLAEAFGGGNSDEPLVPTMLEALDIPFTGASSHNMHLTLDKEKTKLVASSYGILVPPHQILRKVNDKIKKDMSFPLIVKPIREEASIGIYYDNVVSNHNELKRKVGEILRFYRQPALVEQFIDGREISVGIIGNEPELTVFPPLEFLFQSASSPLKKIRSYEYKWGGSKEQMIPVEFLSDYQSEILNAYTRTAFVVTECRDYARMDYRIDKDGKVFLLEVNYNPGIGPNSHGLNNTLTMMASFVGYTFEELVEKIVLTAATRYES